MTLPELEDELVHHHDYALQNCSRHVIRERSGEAARARLADQAIGPRARPDLITTPWLERLLAAAASVRTRLRVILSLQRIRTSDAVNKMRILRRAASG